MAIYTIRKINDTAHLYKDGELTDAKLTIRKGADGNPYFFLPKGYEEVQGQVKTILVEKAIAEFGEYTLKPRVRINRAKGGKASTFNPAEWLNEEDRKTYEALVAKATEVYNLRMSGFADATPAELLELQAMLQRMRAESAKSKK
jgi:hypothetical protein